MHRETVQKLLRNHGVPTKLVNMIKSSYEGMTCRVIHEGQLTNQFANVVFGSHFRFSLSLLG